MGLAMTRDEIVQVKDLKTIEIEVPEWGEGRSVHIREMSALEREELEAAAAADGDSMKNPMGRVAAMSICDASGNRLFTLGEAEALGEKSPAALKRVFDAAVELSKLTNKQMETISGNSSGVQGEERTSA